MAPNKNRTSTLEGRAGKRSLSANMEDYLEVIYRLSEETGSSRVSTIADALGVKRPSVSKAIRRLQRHGLVTHTPYGGAAVTARGKHVAQAQVRSHSALTRFLQEVLALPPDLAEHDACLMEHAISPETVERLVQFIDHLERGGKGVTDEFRISLKARQHRENGDDVRSKRAAAGRSWKSRV